MNENEKNAVLKGSMLSEVCFPNIAMMYKNAGLDFTIIDCEHGAFDYSQVAATVTAFRLSGVRAIVRIPEIRREPITKYLDMGADGLLVPMVKDADDAKRLVGFGKYQPTGNRGLSINRAHSRYAPGDMNEYLAAANRRVRLYAQIELVSALEDVERIAAVDGIDGIFVGPTDLSMALGVFNRLDSPVLLDACRRVAEAAGAAGKVSGIITGNAVVPGDLRLFPVPLFKITGIRRTLRIKIPYTFFVSGMAVKRKVMKICPDPVCFHIFRRNSFFIKALHCFPVFAAIRSGSYLCKNIISHIISGEGINFLRLIRLGDCRHDFVLYPNVSTSIPDNIRAVILRFRKIIRQPQHFAFKTDHRIARKPWCRHFPGMNSDIRTGLQSLFGLRREYYFRLMVYITVFQLQQTAPLRHTLYFYGVCTVSFYFKMYLTLPLTPIKGQAFSLYIYGRSACFQFKSL